MQTPEMAAKWGIDQSLLQDAFDYMNAHHLGFARAVVQRHMERADPAALKVTITDDVKLAASAAGLSPAVLAIVFQLLETFAPVIFAIIQAFFGSLINPPAPKPTPAPSVVAGIVLALVCLLGLAQTGCAQTSRLPAPRDEMPAPKWFWQAKAKAATKTVSMPKLAVQYVSADDADEEEGEEQLTAADLPLLIQADCPQCKNGVCTFPALPAASSQVDPCPSNCVCKANGVCTCVGSVPAATSSQVSYLLVTEAPAGPSCGDVGAGPRRPVGHRIGRLLTLPFRFAAGVRSGLRTGIRSARAVGLGE